MKKILLKTLTVLTLICITVTFTGKVAYADSFKVVTLGADLTKEQKNEMLKYFNVGEKDANILEVTKSEEEKYLANIASASQIGTKSISCSYVEPKSKGGLDVSTYNITWVTDAMIRNALITAGVENAVVKAAAPFKVSGTAALTGILKGFENSSSGKKLDEKKKKVANEEMIVTGQIGEKIGQDEAANLINEVKTEVVKEKPKTEAEIRDIVVNITNNFQNSLSEEEINKITSLMNNINGLNLDFNKIKGQLSEASEKLKETLSSEEAQGFFEGVKNFFSKLFESISSFFSKDATEET